MSHTTWEVDMNHRLGFAFDSWLATNGINSKSLHFKIFGKSEAKATNHTDLEEGSTGLFFEVSGVCKPSSGLMSHYNLSNFLEIKGG